MNIGTLIALAATTAFEDNERLMGVRLSPVSLTAAELRAAVKELRARLGAKAFIVGSAPGVDAADLDARCFTAPDQRAAERATLWRNRVKVGEGERLVYVSVESHAKANGLRDCLVQLRERDLRDAFRKWGEGRDALPPGLVEALEESELLSAVRLSALCAFADRVTRGGERGAGAWRAAGQALPLLHLVTDSRLGKEDGAARLRANHAMVRAIETGEGRRRASTGPLAEVEGQLHASIAGRAPREVEAALTTVDLGALKTSALGRAKPTKPRAPKPENGAEAPAGGKPTKPTKPSPPKGGPDEPPAPGATSPEDAPQPGTESGGSAPRAPRVQRLPGSALPSGLAALLTALLDGPGDPVEVRAKKVGRSLLEELPKTVAPVVADSPRARQRLANPLRAWIDARRAVIDLTRARPNLPALADTLTRGADLLLSDPSFAAAVQRLVDASIALYDAAAEVDERAMREVLALDTVALRGADGAVDLRVIGPLHLLSIGQTLSARAAAHEARDLPEHARRLIARAMEVAPPAPGSLMEGSDDLLLARGASGLLVYERVPDLVSPEDARAAARAVTLRYLAVCPHARLCLRVALSGGGDLGAFVEGVTQALAEVTDRPERVEVLCARPPTFDERPLRDGALADVEVVVGALDDVGARSAHITLRYASEHGAPEDEEAAPPSQQTFAPPGGGRTAFDLRPNGLRVLTGVAGSRELAAVEALSSRAAGLVPRGAFVMRVSGRSLRAECEGVAAEGGWVAIVGRSVGRRAPPGWFLIAHEGVGALATCAVVSREVRAAARSLQEGLSSLGVADMRPRSLLLLAERLATAGRSSLVPLSRPAASLVATGLLAMELKRSLDDPEALVAPITGAVYETLTSEPGDGDDGALLLAAGRAPGGGMRLAVGYATAGENPDIALGKSQLEGAIARRVHRVIDAVHLASQGERADAGAAREALAWALWSAIAADDSSREGWREVLARWRGEVAAPPEALVLVRPVEGRAEERAGKIGRARAVVRPLTLERLNALLLGAR